ncbi:thioredoxin domain-containing protein [Acidimangrovimonas sediminis]|uniref:hydrogenase accessory protein n=1 Tax=Acidimangrovimonas sediminis TaxID=2056283 RepID=UPI000C801281|nr:hydrogenase accessory protein [Acidimangrovimonas sediminis]
MHDHAPPSPDAAPAASISTAPAQTHPLVARLGAELGYETLSDFTEIEAFTGREGFHCLFIPGDARRNLETPDAAVILPELRMTFQNAFDCAVVADAIEAELRQKTRALKTPAFLFWRQGTYLGAIEKVRDWQDYIARTSHILGQEG